MSDRTRYMALFEATNVQFIVKDENTIIVPGGWNPAYRDVVKGRTNDGYDGFYVRLLFHPDGKLKEFGVWE